MTELIKILIVEDHQIVRIGLRVLLQSLEKFLVVGEASDGRVAVDKVIELKPDIVLMDIALPTMDGIEASYQIKSRCPQTRVIMLTSHDTDKDILAALGSGADGFCLKDVPIEQLSEAIVTVHNNGMWLDSRIAERLQQTRMGSYDQQPESKSLDADMLDLLCYVEQGLSNEEIASEMGATTEQLRVMMRDAVEALFLTGDKNERSKQLRKQFAAKIADVSVDTHQSSILTIGEIFADKYLILSHVGRGGMGRVYKAKHIHTEKIVAIKVLLPQFAADRRVVRLFQDEARAAAALVHPNTVQVFDFGITQKGQSFIVMDYIEGTTLETLLRQKGRLTLPEFHNIFDQVCNALVAAHSKDVIHCDIKPGNIVLLGTNDGQMTTKLIDFGLAKILPPPQASIQMQLTDSFDLCGSPAYMSPEQCRGGRLDLRSDLYSLGCVMYEALTGHQAASGLSAMECISKHLQEMPASFASVAPELHLPDSIEEIVFKLLDKNPDARFQTPMQLKLALSKAYFDQFADLDCDEISIVL